MNNEEINIELSDEVADGVYSNLAIIANSSSEFVLDFVRLMPSTSKAKVKSRVIMSPENAKRLMMSLLENINHYEATFGEIPIHQMPGENGSLEITPVGEA